MLQALQTGASGDTTCVHALERNSPAGTDGRFLLACTVWFYLKTYWDFESNYQTWLETANNGEGMSRAEALGLSGDFLGGVLNPILSFSPSLPCCSPCGCSAVS